jgi:predicted kinase
MNDVAFLSMDLTGRGREDLASTFLNAYLECTGDYAGVRHLAFYSVYRALIRAMVDGIGADHDDTRRHELLDRLRSRVRTAASYIDRPDATLIIMHGLSGSGKSWLSASLASRLPAIRLRSDVERKRLGVGVADLYAPGMSRRTYACLLQGAQGCLEGGVNTIVDAAFLDGEDRRRFSELAARLGCRFVIVACEAGVDVLARRIEQRRLICTDPSDATVAVLKRQLRDAEPLTAHERAAAVHIDTAAPDAADKAIAAVRDRLPLPA